MRSAARGSPCSAAMMMRSHRRPSARSAVEREFDAGARIVAQGQEQLDSEKRFYVIRSGSADLSSSIGGSYFDEIEAGVLAPRAAEGGLAERRSVGQEAALGADRLKERAAVAHAGGSGRRT